MLKQVLEILTTTPEKLQREISTMSRREMQTRAAPNKWSVQEVLAHLADVEELGMRSRVVAMVEQENPTLPSFDQEARAAEMEYSKIDPRRSLASLARQRRANVQWLRKLRPAQLKRKGVHEKVGEISAEELITEWAFHDLGHLKQILEIKRYALYPHMGNMQAFYQLS
ncbi:MAG: DinB family protein [Acidobacteriia bacterium]|nr:DinB family protein [Terriglobia bacterium]